MQKLKLPKAKLFYFLITLEKKGVITNDQKGFLKGKTQKFEKLFFFLEEIIKDNQEILQGITLKQRELKKIFMMILSNYNKQQKQQVAIKGNQPTKEKEQQEQNCEINEKLKAKQQSIDILEKNSEFQTIQELIYSQSEKNIDDLTKKAGNQSEDVSSPESGKNALKKRPHKFLDVPPNRQFQYYQVVAEKDNTGKEVKQQKSLKFLDEEKVGIEKQNFQKPPMVRMETIKLEQNVKAIGSFVDYLNYAERIEEKKSEQKVSKHQKNQSNQ